MADYARRYNPDRSADWNYGGPKWRLSRSKIDLFMECPRCFYLDNKLGTGRPRGPAFTLNVAVDTLFKKEFDTHRAAGTPHPIMVEYDIKAVPFQHPEIDAWRENFEGVEHHHQPTGLTVCGAVDDVWQNDRGELIVVDYKSTAKEGKIESLADSAWEEQYRRQIGVYAWLLRQNGFTVASEGYFVYANALIKADTFSNRLEFEVTLIPIKAETDWIEPTLSEIKKCLEREDIPPAGQACEYCPYRQAAGTKLAERHIANNGNVKIT